MSETVMTGVPALVSIVASPTLTKLPEALSKAQSEFKAVGKSGKNEFDHYKYAKLEDFVDAAQEVLSKYDLSIVTSTLDVIALENRTTSKGTIEHVVRVKVALKLLHSSGEWIEALSWGEGQDRADKAIYKAITGARKYGLASLLGLATTDDPEADETVGRDDNTQKPPVSRPSAPVPGPRPAAAAPTPPPSAESPVAAPQPEGASTTETPAPVTAPPTGDDDPALTQKSGPCVDCGKEYYVAQMTKVIERLRGQGKKVRWAHSSIPGFSCETAAKNIEKTKTA